MAALTSDTVPIVWIKDIHKFVCVHVISIFSEGDSCTLNLFCCPKKKLTMTNGQDTSKLIAMPI